MQTVILLTKEGLSKAKAAYENDLVPCKAKSALFQAKKNGVTITAYRSGKVLFQGANHDRESSRFQGFEKQRTPGPSTVTSSKTKKKRPTLPQGFADWGVIGSDEVGAGAYFGPLTTAAVYVPRNKVDELRQMGFADSKNLTDDKIEQLAPYIIKNLPYHIVNLTPDFYNQKQESGQNVVAMKALSHNFTHNQVLAKLDGLPRPDAILVDQFVQGSSYYRYLTKNQQIRPDLPTYFITKGESEHVAVAAASVLARFVELKSMQELSAEAGVTLPIGAGKEADRTAAKLMKQKKDLRHFAKLHFANTKKAQALL
ncbi:ribonuclease HIII [Fructobacillus sp. M1-13]|uniref:Ribonuclease HIII n=1 Tax=Fructobacillus papyriferae TaxID=2713171 RepID=A0ABS5QQG3_9LACO|nr:ribonuclease HIII [Fructobacillus papyriferae]MBS9335428.1 ribonuclease HIII [Fructobacillus papyriferae]MCD2158901.1 ribonuclease HIII [Fructobacillus papyriferae]